MDVDKENCNHEFVVEADGRKLIWQFCIKCKTLLSTKEGKVTPASQERMRKGTFNMDSIANKE